MVCVSLIAASQDHEDHLAKLLNRQCEESKYRAEHLALAEGIDKFQSKFKGLKQEVFD
ncbi:MAG: hypothetical protein ACI9HG_001983 [Flavobacteriales bacterium]